MASSGLEKLLGRDMPEIAYLKNTNVAQVLSKGLAEAFRKNPSDPKTYFGKFLLNYAQEEEIKEQVSFINHLHRGHRSNPRSSYIIIFTFSESG